MPNTSSVLIIAGPTASGKSRLAIDAAQTLNGVILNCDAMQIYKDIPIIAATPNAEEKASAEHRLFELYDVKKRGNVVEWLDLCVAEIRALWHEQKLPIVVGGTGMYIDALINGVTPIPEVPQDMRRKIARMSLSEMYAFLQKNDSLIAEKLHPNDKTRLSRAVEVISYTGIKLSEWYRKPMLKKLSEAEFKVVKILPEIDEIEQRCRKRLNEMVTNGVLEEIATLLKRNIDESLPAMKALGVPELSMAVKGKMPLNTALELAKLHTRQYAKRQRTWLKNKLTADIEFTEPYIGQPDWIAKIEQFFRL